MTDATLQLPDDRTIGYVDYGPADGVPNAALRLTENDGHFSIVGHVPEVLAEMIKAAG